MVITLTSSDVNTPQIHYNAICAEMARVYHVQRLKIYTFLLKAHAKGIMQQTKNKQSHETLYSGTMQGKKIVDR